MFFIPQVLVNRHKNNDTGGYHGQYYPGGETAVSDDEQVAQVSVEQDDAGDVKFVQFSHVVSCLDDVTSIFLYIGWRKRIYNKIFVEAEYYIWM